MNNLEFLEIVHGQFSHCVDVLEEKREEFERDTDRLAQFKNEFADSPLMALRGLMVKHTLTLNDMMKDGKSMHQSKDWTKAITHSINYLFLLSALLKEIE